MQISRAMREKSRIGKGLGVQSVCVVHSAGPQSTGGREAQKIK